MATTSVGTDRQPYDAFERYPDAVFMTDDTKMYFGTDGDISLSYDSESDVLVLDGSSTIVHDINTSAGTVALDADTAAIPITHPHVLMAGSDTAATRTLADGANGQIITITLSDGHPLSTITPATATGFTSVCMSDTFDTVCLRFVNTAGWIVTGAHLPANGSIV